MEFLCLILPPSTAALRHFSWRMPRDVAHGIADDREQTLLLQPLRRCCFQAAHATVLGHCRWS